MKYPRGKTAARGYGGKWQRERAAYLKANPLCAMHKERGQTVPATVVDHKVPHKGDKKLMWDRKNWQALCKSCHDGPKQSQDRTGVERGCDKDGVPLDPRHRWNQ